MKAGGRAAAEQADAADEPHGGWKDSKVVYLHLKSGSQLIRGVGRTLEPCAVPDGAIHWRQQVADDIVAALDTVMAAATPWDYLVAQDAAVPVCRAKYDALCEVADGHPDADVRWEALQMISLIGADDHRARLQFALETDVDDRVRECAKVLLFRSRVRERVVASGRLTPEGVDAYVRSVREGAARHFFKQPS